MLRKVALACVALLALLGLLSLVSATILAIYGSTVSRTAQDAPKPIPPQTTAEARYLELLKRALSRYGLESDTVVRL